jgi:hypothetical protein
MPMRNVSYAVLMVLGTLFGSLGLLAKTSPHSPPPTPKQVAIASSPVPTLRPLSSAIARIKPIDVRPRAADNGSPFPTKSGYIAKYPQKFTDGYSSVTVDNSKNNSDLFIKLFSLDSQLAIPVSVFFVRAKDSFTVKEIRAGKYEVRYQDLNSGVLSRTESFTLKEVEIQEGVEFSKLTLTLHKVLNGNLKAYPISEAEFEK